MTGYSLGAGICQLVAMDLLQERPNVRCISYGAPLIFAPDSENPDPHSAGQHLYTVVRFESFKFFFLLPSLAKPRSSNW